MRDIAIRKSSRGLQHRQPRRQRGVVLIFALIALLILGIGAVSLIRSFDTATLTSTNLAFKRDLTSEGALAFAQAAAWFPANGTALGNPATQYNDNAAYNYFATTQPTNQFGIPTRLMSGNLSSDSASLAALQLGAPYSSGLQPGVTVYFVIDRLCDSTTTAPTIDHCMLGMTAGAAAACKSAQLVPGPGQNICTFGPIYRISVRVDGPHNTHTFMQQTATMG